MISASSDLFQLLQNCLSKIQVSIASPWGASCSMVFFYRIECFQFWHLLYPKRKTRIHWAFRYSTWSLGSVWLEARYSLKLAAAGPAVSLTSHLGTANRHGCLGAENWLRKSPEGAIGNCICLCSQCEVAHHGYNDGSRRKNGFSSVRGSGFWIDVDFERDTALLSKKIALLYRS